MIGKTVSHYKITRELGAGGMGVVYEAVDTKLDRTVALKFLPPDSTRDPVAKVRFIHEAKAVSSLDHPNVCTLHEIGTTDDGQLFIVMACYEGETLQDRIAQGPLPIDEAVDISLQIANGLAKAHEQDIVHRDIKPANIFITSDGLVKILDFGLAKLSSQTMLTKTGTTLGTAGYMSPEQAGGETTDRRTDVWSLGVVMYEMVTGKRPFGGEHPQAVIYAILNRDPEMLTGLRDDIPPEIERIVNKTLSKDLTGRYRNAGDLAADLALFCGKDSASRWTPWPTGNQGSRLRPGFILGIVGILATVTCLGVAYLPGIIDGEGNEHEYSRVMLAVLPFENLGSPDDAYFTDGITDEILTKLSTIPDLGVIARESSFKFRGDDFTIGEIGKQLGVDFILKGAVRWQNAPDGSIRIRVTPKLISVEENRNIWAEAFEVELTGVFAVQAGIAEKVSGALNITLLDSDILALAVRPTENLEAYNNFLRARELSGNNFEGTPLRAVELLEKAVRLDPEFALGYAWLSINHGRIFHNIDRTQTRIKLSKASLDAATALDPDLPDVKLAAGAYAYHSTRDYGTALTHLLAAKSQRPNDMYILKYISAIKKRQGLFDEAATLFRQARVLNPMSPSLILEEGICHKYNRRFDEAEKCFRYMTDMWPDLTHAYSFLASNYIFWDGNSERARSVLEGSEGIVPHKASVAEAWFWIWKLEGKYEEALDLLRRPANEFHTLGWELAKAEFFYYLDRTAQQFAVADSVRIRLEEKVGETPGDHTWRRQLGVAYALSGRMEDAIREGRAALELMPVARDAIAGVFSLRALAFIYVLAGEHEQALELLEYLLSIPSSMTKQLLRNDPAWAPLRDHPRFQQLVQ